MKAILHQEFMMATASIINEQFTQSVQLTPEIIERWNKIRRVMLKVSP